MPVWVIDGPSGFACIECQLLEPGARKLPGPFWKLQQDGTSIAGKSERPIRVGLKRVFKIRCFDFGAHLLPIVDYATVSGLTKRR
jgi:hypothetical protein